VPVPDSWAMQNPVLYTLIWSVAIVAVFAPLSVRQYRLSTRK
jgi:ABC-2 type transport system permease protein